MLFERDAITRHRPISTTAARLALALWPSARTTIRALGGDRHLAYTAAEPTRGGRSASIAFPRTSQYFVFGRCAGLRRTRAYGDRKTRKRFYARLD